MKLVQNKRTYQFDQYWFLGFLGFIGFYSFPEVWVFLEGNGSAWSLTNLLWFLWFLNFLPKKNN